MKIKAIILSFLILFGGSGLSLDLVQCCNRLAGVSISFGGNNENIADKDCCHCIKIKKDKSCCNDVVVQTPINSVLYNKTENKKLRIESSSFISIHSNETLNNIRIIEQPPYTLSSVALCEIPLLLKKRVLQI
ncbi:MAG: hypothetical protein Q8K70_01755 [Bacteroidota bacterium]|nr:hypothetical protein [Bacteroidota bacterium]